MQEFATHFCVTLLHSLWQSGLLFLMYLFISHIRKVNPSAKRNILFAILVLQLIISTFLFWLLSAEVHHNWFNMYSDAPPEIFLSVKNMYVYLLFTYFLCVLYKLTSQLYHYKQFNDFKKQSFIKPNAYIRVFTQLNAAALGVKKVQIWLSENIHTPFTYGFLKPCIVLPVALINQLSVKETEALIIHELTHIKNKDYLLNYLVLLMETMYCFNPFIFLITKNIKWEREKTCDLQVVEFNYAPALYAETLLKTAQHNNNQPIWQIGAISKRKQLLNRILFFTRENDFSNMKKNFHPISYALMLFIAFMSIIVLAEDTTSNKNTNTENSTKFLMPSFSYHLPVNTEEPSVKISTPTVAEARISKTQKYTSAKKNIAVETPLEISETSIHAMHVNDAPEISKQIIIKEQDPSTGKTSTYIFKSTFVNGMWTAEPIVSVIETKADSCSENIKVEVKGFNREQ